MTLRIWHQGFIDMETVPDYTPALERHLTAICRPGTSVTLHGMPPGAYEGTSPAEVARHAYISGLYTNELVDSARRAEAEGFDAVVLAIIQNIGVREARTVIDIPVTNYGESAMHLACMVGRRFGVLAFNRDLLDLIEANIYEYGLERRAAPIQLVQVDYELVARGFVDPTPLIDAFTESARLSIASGADVLIPGQMIFAEILWQNGVYAVDGVPVVDALGACVKMAELMVDLKRTSGLSQSRRGFWGSKPPESLIQQARSRYLANP